MSARALPKLFVSNLPWTISSNELKKYFTEFGHVTYANVVFDKDTGLSKGFGFVTFSTKGGIDSVLNKSSHSMEGNNLTIQPTN